MIYKKLGKGWVSLVSGLLLPLKKLGVGIEKRIVFCSDHNVLTLFRNLQKWSFECRDRDTLPTMVHCQGFRIIGRRFGLDRTTCTL